jgi:uracil-DNA glycosylase
MDASEILKEVASQVVVCQKCALSRNRKRSVPGDGPADSKIMFIGEGPGFHENEQGLPFVGAAGKYLDELLKKGGVTRKEVFITNVVKCRPPGNRDPLPEELAACSEYLDRQTEAINPLVIVTLGRYSMARYFPNAKISSIHGKSTWLKNRLIIPMYHPAAALHQPALKNELEKDFSQLTRWIEEALKSRRPQLKNSPEVNEEEDPKQLSLF